MPRNTHEEIETLLAPAATGPLAIDFEAIETAARRQVLQVAVIRSSSAIEGRFNSDTSDYVGPTAPCLCGKRARYVERRSKNFETVLGTLRLERAYYHCRRCEQGFCPRDHCLGLNKTSLSPALRRMTAAVGCSTSFHEGSDLLWELAGVRVDAKQVERVSEALGREIADDEKHFVERARPTMQASTIYLSMGGTGVPMRKSELKGIQGKQPDGSAKTREAKLCTIWSAESRNEQGHPIRDRGSISYSAAIESAANRDTDETPSPFAERVLREAHRRGFDCAQRQVIIGDGAVWIWKLADMYFPDAIQIVDRFHAKKQLSDVAKAIYDAQSDLAKSWAERRHEELDEGRIDALLRALRRHRKHSHEARQCIGYIRTNRHRLRYPEFEAKNLCTSSAVVESGCKLVVASRFKGS